MVAAVGSLLGSGYSVKTTTRVMETVLEQWEGQMKTDLGTANDLLQTCITSTLRSRTFQRSDAEHHRHKTSGIELTPLQGDFLRGTTWGIGTDGYVCFIKSCVPALGLLQFLPSTLSPSMDVAHQELMKLQHNGFCDTQHCHNGDCGTQHAEITPSRTAASLGFSLVHSSLSLYSRDVVVRLFIGDAKHATSAILLCKGKWERAFVESWLIHCLHKLLYTEEKCIRATDEQIKALIHDRFGMKLDNKIYYGLKAKFISRVGKPASKFELLREMVKGKKEAGEAVGMPSKYALTGLGYLLYHEGTVLSPANSATNSFTPEHYPG